ncbi:hypothetical protein KKF59_03160 [Patescibacteria group bacterium]|nr:hypothetical protein [Patescibacteria group bacterium]
MYLWPVIIALLVLGAAYALFRILPEIIDQDNSFLHVIAIFIIIYMGAAYYLSRRLPDLNVYTKTPQTETSAKNFDIVVKDGQVGK